MIIFNRDIFIGHHFIKTQHPRPFFRVDKGWSKGDWEVILGPYYIVISYANYSPRIASREVSTQDSR